LTRILLNNAKRFDKLSRTNDIGAEEALDTVDDILLSPVLSRVLCNPTNFSFQKSIVVKLDRAEIGDFDAFLLASFLIEQFKGEVIIPDGGFYLRDFYSTLIRQNRLIASATFLSELSPNLQQMVLSIKQKTVFRTTVEDAERLVFYTRHTEPKNLFEQGDGEYLTT
jgi:hypothetical protein